MHTEAYQFLREHVPANVDTVLDLGSRETNGSPRYLFTTDVRYLGIDLMGGRGVDLVLDAASRDLLPTLANRFGWSCHGGNLHPGVDLVVCMEVAEHATDPAAIVSNAWRALRPGGSLIFTCATDPRAPHSAVEGGALRDGEHYRNIPESEMLAMLEPFTEVIVRRDDVRGDLCAKAVRP